MTKLLDEAVEEARRLPVDRQDEIASTLMLYAKLPVVALTQEEVADIAEADAEVARGDYATDEEMKRLWAKYGP